MFHLTNKNRSNVETETGHVSLESGAFLQSKVAVISMTIFISIFNYMKSLYLSKSTLTRKVPEFLGIASQCALSKSTSLEFVVHRQLEGVVLFLSLVGVFLT